VVARPVAGTTRADGKEAALAACGAPAPSEPVAPAMDPVARGEYIVNTSGCHDCHTPWAMGPNGPEPDIGESGNRGIEISRFPDFPIPRCQDVS